MVINDCMYKGLCNVGNMEGACCGTAQCEQYKPIDVDKMVDRFLGWELPKNFSPDAGISFKASNNPTCWPVGTNLFTAEQAKEMIRHMLGFYS